MNVANEQKFDGVFNDKIRTPMVSESTNQNRKPRNSYHGKDTAKHEFEITKLCDKCGCYTHPTNK